MRVKHLWNYVPLPQSLRLVWDRLTLSRLTTVYLAVASIHCLVQVLFQISAFYVNQDATHVLTHIAAVDPNIPVGYAVLTNNGPLRACTGMPGSTGSTTCRMVWSGGVAPDAFGGNSSYTQTSTTTSSSSTALVTSTTQSRTVVRVSTVVVTNPLTVSSAVQTQSTTSLASSSSAVATPTPSVTSPLTRATLSTTALVSSTGLSASTAVVLPSSSSTVSVGRARVKRVSALIPRSKVHALAKRDLSLTPVFSQFNGTFQGVRINGLLTTNYDGPNQVAGEAFLSNVCVDALQWPLQKLWNTQREDAVFIGFQFWVLGMSVVALLNESVPHVIAAFLTHLLATGWAAFQLAHTTHFRSEFNRLTTRGACGGVNLLPTYWKARADAEIPVLVLNVVVLFASAYMSWRLLKTFGWLTFKRVGASLEINRIYRAVLCLSIVLQLSLFFMIVSMVLWIIELYSGPAAKVMSLSALYKAIVAIQLAALVPWLIMGWYAVRREMRKTMIAFIALSVLFIVAWAAMFASTTWRLEFLTWMFFRMVSVCATILTVLALGLGIVCFNGFGKGLPKYLHNVEDLESANFEPASAQPFFDPEKAEKVEFPSQNAYPTFSVAFPSRPGSTVSGHSHTRSGSGSSSLHSRKDSEAIPVPRQITRLRQNSTTSGHSHTRSGSGSSTLHSRQGSEGLPVPRQITRLPQISTISGHSHTRSDSGSRSIHSRLDSEAIPVPRQITRLPPPQDSEAERPMSTATSNTSVRDPFEHDLMRVMSNAYPTMRSVASNRSADTAPAYTHESIAMGKRWIIE